MEPRRTKEERLRRLQAVLLDPRFVAWTLIALAVVAALQEWLLGPKEYGGRLYTHYNNFRIYKMSFWHLVRGEDLYARHPLEQWDLFKYSPTFAALMAPFAVLPDVAGLILWNLLNAGVMVLALSKLPVLPPRSKALMAWFLVPEFMTAAQNTQANILLAGLVLLAFAALESDRPGLAALLIVTAFYVKIYPLLAALLFLLYPRKRRFLAWSAVWLVVLGAAPLLLVSFDRFQACYVSWSALLTSDHDSLTGLSVMRVLHAWFHLDPPKILVALAGLAITVAPLARARIRDDARFRLLFLASLLISMVILNHEAESATFVVAVCGVGLWYFAVPRGRGDRVLLALAFLFTSMSPRFPRWLIIEVMQPYAIKAIPCIVIWLALTWELSVRTLPDPAPAPRPAPADPGA